MITSDVKFIRKYLYSMGEKYSKFRGKGRISFDNDSIVMSGKRAYPPMTLLAVFIPLMLITFFLIYKVSYLFQILYAVLLIAYYIFQSFFLKKEVITLPWPQITKYEVDKQSNMIAFSIENNPKCSPVVFITENFDEIAAMFREKMQSRERTSHGWTALEQRYDEQMNWMAKSVDRWFKGKGKRR